MVRLYLFTCLLLIPLTSQASDVLIKTLSSTGQGFLYKNESECYVVTPSHVIGGNQQVTLLTADRKKHTAIKFHEFDVDLSLLKVTSSPSPCVENHTPINKLSTILTVVSNGELQTKLDDASTLRTPITVVGIDANEFLSIKPLDPDRPFKQGFSGSILYIANSISGILIEVDGDYGYIYRYDALEEHLKAFFGISDDKKSVDLKPQSHNGLLAEDQIVEFQLELQKNSPIEIISNKL
ncbi:S1C family serine protease, partial [Marinomonas profundimaris]|uniref:S1C family serine protease n=1 Tax=Marinomonas profundimaris TaxID=1208321 RepID=UPI000560D049